MLFWKNAKECVEIVDGYGTYKSQSARNSGKILWTEEQEMELKQLYEEHKDGEGVCVRVCTVMCLYSNVVAHVSVQ